MAVLRPSIHDGCQVLPAVLADCDQRVLTGVPADDRTSGGARHVPHQHLRTEDGGESHIAYVSYWYDICHIGMTYIIPI